MHQWIFKRLNWLYLGGPIKWPSHDCVQLIQKNIQYLSLNISRNDYLIFFKFSNWSRTIWRHWNVINPSQLYNAFIFQIPFSIQLNNGYPTRNDTDNLNNRNFISKLLLQQVVNILLSCKRITKLCPLKNSLIMYQSCIFVTWEVTGSNFSFLGYTQCNKRFCCPDRTAPNPE